VGLIAGLLTLPLAPARGVVRLAELVQAQADREYEEQEGLQARLAGIEDARAAGELSEEESADLEQRVLDGLWAPREAIEDGSDGGARR
jgi:gas vesicle protein GvpG